jgi:hypothetical protein
VYRKPRRLCWKATISVLENKSIFLFYLQIIIHICPTIVQYSSTLMWLQLWLMAIKIISAQPRKWYTCYSYKFDHSAFKPMSSLTSKHSNSPLV